MSVARAPGKLVLSGAYSVLEGAPAIVAAVDRYAVADSALPARVITSEVAAAVKRGLLRRAVGFDASALRELLADGDSRKLGLGSSAAILVASLAAEALDAGVDEGALGAHVFPDALACHRRAQGGGSGVDVAASAFGGVLACRLDAALCTEAGAGLTVAPHTLPTGLLVETWLSPEVSSTAGMLARIRHFAASPANSYGAHLEVASGGAEAARVATTVAELVVALTNQWGALAALGHDAGVPIFSPAASELACVAAECNAAFGPAGAGGGDVAIYLGGEPSGERFRHLAQRRGFRPLALALGASGVGIG